ncbi:hypothetical protein LXL04_001167 [Taraxacum kok-saghyz]
MKAMTSKYVLFLAMITLLVVVVVSADSSYGKTQVEGLLPPKDEHGAYKKSEPKIPTTTTKPVIPTKEEHGGYKKSNPKIPTKPMIPKEEYGKSKKPKIPAAKPVIPKLDHEKSSPKIPMIPKEEHGGYKKENPKTPTKPVIPKEEHRLSPKIPTEPVIPKEEHGANGKPVVPKVAEHPNNIAVQGLIYCKYGSKLIPLKGATVRVTCLGVHKNGHESAPFSFSSCPADVKGYFLAKIASSELLKQDLWEVKECKSFLENSPWTGCKVPEDTNGGITGAHLTFTRMLNGYSLSSVGPFIYNPGPQPSLPKEGY